MSTGFFDGEDIAAVSRTAWDDGLGGAEALHDANLMTFHRIQAFRTQTMEDSVTDPSRLGIDPSKRILLP